jgi:hypothetical protein
VSEAPEQNGMPRGVLAVVIVGLIACVAAALLATDKGSGEAADLEWVVSKPISDSKREAVPGGGGEMQLVGAGIRATGSNASGYSLYRSLAVLEISAGAPVGSSRIDCSMRAPEGSEVAQTHNHRASYPRSSEELYEQEVPEVLLLEFSSHGDELAVVDVTDLPKRFATERGINLVWPEYTLRHEGWHWFLPPGKPTEDLVFPFISVWKSTAVPSVKIACTVNTSAGKTTVRTAGSLPDHPEPIAE